MTRRKYVALVLLVLGIAWWLVNKSFGEGPILWHYAEGHAITLTDLISVAAWIAAVLVWRHPRNQP